MKKTLIMLALVLMGASTAMASTPNHEDHYLTAIENADVEDMSIKKRTTYYLDVLSIFSTQERILAFLNTGDQLKQWVETLDEKDNARYMRAKERWVKKHPMSQNTINSFFTTYYTFFSDQVETLDAPTRARAYSNLLWELADNDNFTTFQQYYTIYGSWYTSLDEAGRASVDAAYEQWAADFPERVETLSYFLEEHDAELNPVVEEEPEVTLEPIETIIGRYMIELSRASFDENELNFMVVIQNLDTLSERYGRPVVEAAMDAWLEQHPMESAIIGDYLSTFESRQR